MSEQQPFDSSLKDLVQEQAAEIIPHLLEGAQFIDTLNVEMALVVKYVYATSGYGPSTAQAQSRGAIEHV